MGGLFTFRGEGRNLFRQPAGPAPGGGSSARRKSHQAVRGGTHCLQQFRDHDPKLLGEHLDSRRLGRQSRNIVAGGNPDFGLMGRSFLLVLDSTPTGGMPSRLASPSPASSPRLGRGESLRRPKTRNLGRNVSETAVLTFAALPCSPAGQTCATVL